MYDIHTRCRPAKRMPSPITYSTTDYFGGRWRFLGGTKTFSSPSRVDDEDEDDGDRRDEDKKIIIRRNRSPKAGW